MTLELRLPEVVNPIFAFSASLGAGERRLDLRLTGAADARATADLEAFTRRAHEEARRLGVPEVSVDLSELSFMSSSCLKAFVIWLSEVRELAPHARYKLRFVWDEKCYWQRRSLQALKTFAEEIIEL